MVGKKDSWKEREVEGQNAPVTRYTNFGCGEAQKTAISRRRRRVRRSTWITVSTCDLLDEEGRLLVGTTYVAWSYMEK